MRRLAYLGPPGTFTEEAALKFDAQGQLLPYETEAAVAAAVEAGEADEGVLAIENSLEGSVTRTLDALVHDVSLAIRGELVLDIEHCLIAAPGTPAQEVRIICGHPQALAQCRKFIEGHYPQATEQAALSNAAAVQDALRIAGAAAIGPARAAAIYGAAVLERGIQDSAQNQTRFVLLGTSDAEPTGHDKTSLAFTVAHDRPGTLVEVLHEFADRGINLTKIESRPSREELGIYIFLVDMEGHRSDPVVAEALAAVQKKTYIFRVLGSYPRFDDARDP